VLGLALVMVGCATRGFDRASATASQLQTTANELVEARDQVDRTLAALTDLVDHPQRDLRPQFRTYERELDRLLGQAERVDRQAANVTTRGQAYFDTWDQQIATIQDPQVRARSEARRKEVSTALDKSQASFQDVRTNYQPLGGTLTSIRTALSTDLTQGGLNSVRDLVRKANGEAASLKRSLDGVVANLRELATKMAPATALAQ
jgi:chromosome segregation ATPase